MPSEPAASPNPTCPNPATSDALLAGTISPTLFGLLLPLGGLPAGRRPLLSPWYAAAPNRTTGRRPAVDTMQ